MTRRRTVAIAGALVAAFTALGVGQRALVAKVAGADRAGAAVRGRPHVAQAAA